MITNLLGTKLTLYKYVVFTPGQSFSWFSEMFVTPEAQLSFPPHSHGYVVKAHIPRSCDSSDLVKFLNGADVSAFQQETVAKLVDGKYWEILTTVPTAEEVADAFLRELRED